MESLLTTINTLISLQNQFNANSGIKAWFEILPIRPAPGGNQRIYASGRTDYDYFGQGIDRIFIRLPVTEHPDYQSDYFRTIEASIVFCHEINHVFQRRLYYPSCSEQAIDLATFDIVESCIREFRPKSYPEFYYCNPCEIQSELFGIKYGPHFIGRVRPDISQEELADDTLNFVNQRLAVNKGKWFFPRFLGRKYFSLDVFLADASKRYNASFNERVKLPNLNTPNLSPYLARLNKPDYFDLSKALLHEKSGKVTIATLANIVSDMNPVVLDERFGRNDVKFVNSLLCDRRDELWHKVDINIQNMNPSSEKCDERELD